MGKMLNLKLQLLSTIMSNGDSISNVVCYYKQPIISETQSEIQICSLKDLPDIYYQSLHEIENNNEENLPALIAYSKEYVYFEVLSNGMLYFEAIPYNPLHLKFIPIIVPLKATEGKVKSFENIEVYREKKLNNKIQKLFMRFLEDIEEELQNNYTK
jgi:hypothetical protein